MSSTKNSRQKHDDITVSLHPLSFAEALKKLTETPPEKPARNAGGLPNSWGGRFRGLAWIAAARQ